MPEPRSVIAQPDFTQIFASAAALGELLTWPSEDYLRGWGYLQPQEAPPMEYFNAFYNGTDTKLLYLFSAANIRKNSTAYQVDDILTSPNLNSQFWLVCTQAGTTDNNEPDYSEVEANQEIIDGTAKFLVTPKVSKGITVGDTEPDNPREGDLWLQTSSSKKTAELKQRTASGWSKVLIETILNAVTDSPIKTLERNTACNINTVYAEVTLPKGGFLICTQAGTTGASAATGFLDAEEGEEVTDGTAKFVVHYFEEIASNKSVVKSINDILPDEEGNVNLQTGLNLLSRSKAYQYGDIAYSPKLPSWAYLFCVTAGTTAASEPSFSGVNTMGQYITDGTVKWIVDDVRFNIPVGVPFYDTYLHDGCVKLNGATVNRADYVRPAKIATDKNLWTSSPSTEPYKYGNGNGSTTMTLPDYRNRVIQGGDSVSRKSAGLPNIKGFMQIRKLASYQQGDLEAMYADGTLFYAEDKGGEYLKFGWDHLSENQNTGLRQINFSASRYNSIYGNSSTVQPAAISLIPQIKY